MRGLTFSLLFASAVSCFAQTPAPIQPPATQNVILTVQGRGSQTYNCQQTGSTFQWVFQAPVARLFDEKNVEVGTHGDGPSWTYQDSSAIQGLLLSKAPAPAATDIPWLLLKAVKPLRTGILTTAEYIARTNTQGGIAPAAGCDAIHKGDLIRVPYSATYTFYSSAPPKTGASN
jgi:hypothetical protein